MFTKASERLYVAFIVNMGKTNKNSATEAAKIIRAKYFQIHLLVFCKTLIFYKNPTSHKNLFSTKPTF